MELIKEIDEQIPFENYNIRIVGTYTEPWFVAKDICQILDIKDSRSALRAIPDDWKVEHNLPTFGGNQNVSIINEAGLYRLIMRSNKPVAQKFQEVVCKEILPSLRLKGQYTIQSIYDKYKTLEDEKLRIENDNKLLEDDNIKLTEEKLRIEKERMKIEKEKLRIEKEKIALEKEKRDLSVKLALEEVQVIKTKRSLEVTQKKFTHRHKFSEENGCVYVLKDPHNRFNKYKIGFTHDINERLADDRTMIPQIKVLFIMYTSHYKLFEQIIKIKYEMNFEYQSHEWIVLDKSENEKYIINGIREIDRTCEFNGKIELDLWRYNLETSPESKKIIQELKEKETEEELTLIEDENLFDRQHLNFAGKLSLILPTYLLRYEYEKKNSEASEGSRYCNGFCQMYQSIDFFPLRSLSPLTICIKCDSMVDVANMKILNGALTAEQIRNDPKLLDIKDDERICRKCNKIKNKEEFPEKRRQCKTCRYAVRSKFGKDFENQIDNEINILNNLTFENKVSKITMYVKDELQKIMQYLKITRKFNDTKQIMINKIISHYKPEIL
jgi:prophage antirepressor-like protein